MTSAPSNHWFGRSPPDLSLSKPSTGHGFRRHLFSESLGTVPKGLEDAYDSLPTQVPGIIQKFQVRRGLSPSHHYVITDKRMPARCPCCGAESQLHCSTCVWEHFLRPHNFPRRRDILNRKKAELGTKLKQILQQEADDQTQLFQKRRRIAQLKAQIEDKKDSIEHLKVIKESKHKELQRTQKNVEALQKKTESHRKKIENQKEAEQKLRNAHSEITRQRNQMIAKHHQQLSSIFSFNESAPQPSNDNPENKIQQMIEEAGFADKIRYSEVAKRTPKPKSYYRVRGCLVPGESDYSDVLNEITDHRTLATRSSRETIAGLAYMAQYVNAISCLYDLYVPFKLHIDDLMACEIWSRALFQTDVFCLNLSIALICLHAGIEAKQIQLKKPFNNLKLLQEVLRTPEARSIAVFHPKDDKLHQEISSELGQIAWEESAETGFDINDVEDDWVDVVKTH